jgi:adenylyl- and sulfurtransferase ThiI
MKKKQTKKKDKEKKRLYIQIKDDIYQILDKYCEETETKYSDITYVFGILNALAGGRLDLMDNIQNVYKIFFFAGVYYGAKNDIKLEYKTNKEIKKSKEENKKNEVNLKPKENKEKSNSSYIG